MSVSLASSTLCCRRCLSRSSINSSLFRTTSIPFRQCAPSRRWQSSAADTPTNPKISTLVDQISQLTLLETADLTQTLKNRLNIPDLPIGGFAAPPPGTPTAGAAPAEEEEAPAPVQEKTLFTLTLKSFEATSKPKVIKEIKNMLGLSLVDSKKFVESAPKMMKEGVPKDEGEKIMETMKGLGAVVGMD